MKKLKVNTVYDVTINTKTGGKKKNRDLNFEQRATFIGSDNEFAKFIVKPAANNPVFWKVLKEKIIRAVIAKGPVKVKE